MEALREIAVESWQVLGQMSPYLLFGFAAAGFLSVWISPARVERHLGGGGYGPVLKASLFGVPLPLCSCSVLPVSASLRRHGASRAATTSFLLSTPQTGVDSIAVTYGLLGPVFAVFRPLAALITGLLGGALVQLFGGGGKRDGSAETAAATCQETCCAGDAKQSRLVRALRYGFVTLPRDIGPALLVGVLIAGAMGALIPEDRLSAYVGGGLASILLLMALGVPVYVCATASVPIAAGFIHLGASPGAALAFLIAGPATNAAAFTTIWKVLGRRPAALYLATVAVSAVACGLILNALLPATGIALPALGTHAHDAGGSSWLPQLSAVLLLGVIGFSYRSRFAAGAPVEEEDADEGSIALVIQGMTCSHCADNVRGLLEELPEVRSAQVSLGEGRAVVRGERLDPERIAAAVSAAGYETIPEGMPPLAASDRPRS